MKCHLVNVVDNYHILITDTQFLGLNLFKEQFNNDEMVEAQFNRWFRHGHDVDIPVETFLKLSGLTYFAPIGKEIVDMRTHIKTACELVETKARKTGPKSRVKRKRQESLESEIETQLLNANIKRSRVEILDTVQESQISDDILQQRTMVKADDGTAIPALCTWLMGSFVGNGLYKAGYTKSLEAFFKGDTSIFSVNDARDLFLSPWDHHPDTYGQVAQVINNIRPLDNRVVNALGALDPSNVLHGMSANDFYSAIVRGSTSTMEVTSEMKIEIANLLRSTNTMEMFRILKGRGEWGVGEMTPERITNIGKVYLHFNPSNLVTNVGKMLTNVVTWSYMKDVYTDIAPDALQERVNGVLDDESTIKQVLEARTSIGDQNSAVLENKIVTGFVGTMIGTTASVVAGVRTAANVYNVAKELNKYRKGEKTNISRAVIKSLLDADNLYNMACYMSVSALEVVAVSSAVSSGVVVSTLGGPATMGAYVGTLVLKEIVNNVARKSIGMGPSAKVSAVMYALTIPKKVSSVSMYIGKRNIKVGNRMRKALFPVRKRSKLVDYAGNKRKRADEIEDAVQEHKRRLVIKDVQSSVNIREKYWSNNYFRHNAMTHMMIHI